MIKIILVGSGKWGQNYIKTLSEQFPNVKLFIANRDNWEILINEGADGVIVCTPPSSHVKIASHSLDLGIPTMIEKPLSLSFESAQLLNNFTAPILVNHIHLFSNAYQEIKKMLVTQKINKIISLGYNCGPYRDYSGLWDYGSHDVSMILDLLRVEPSWVTAVKVKTELGSLFNIQMKFNDIQTDSVVGNGSKISARKFSVFSGGVELVYDEKNQPSLPLTNAIRVFLNTIDGDLSDYRLGLELSLSVIKVLEICQKTLLIDTSTN